MSSEEKPVEPSIVVDDDWKARVQAEKEAARKQKESGSTESAKTDKARDYPPASFEILVSTYSTQAMVAMGFFPDPVSGKPAPDHKLAKHLVDMLGVIETISKGNVSEDESAMVSGVLHQLRMAFLSPKKSATAATEKPAAPSPVIELP